DVASQAAQVRPTTHRGAEAHIGRGEGLELELRHLDAPRSQHHALAAARPPVGSLARHLHRRVGGRPLVVRPAEPGQRLLPSPPPSWGPRSKRSICWACSSPRSSSKRSSGVTRNGSSLASWARRKRAALVRPSSDFALSSSLPITLTRTRAYAKSPDTSTAVT